MPTSLSKLVDNLSDRIHNNKCINCKSCLDYMKTKDEKLIFRWFNCQQNYEKDFNKELIIKDLQIHMNFVITTLIN